MLSFNVWFCSSSQTCNDLREFYFTSALLSTESIPNTEKYHFWCRESNPLERGYLPSKLEPFCQRKPLWDFLLYEGCRMRATLEVRKSSYTQPGVTVPGSSRLTDPRRALLPLMLALLTGTTLCQGERSPLPFLPPPQARTCSSAPQLLHRGGFSDMLVIRYQDLSILWHLFLLHLWSFLPGCWPSQVTVQSWGTTISWSLTDVSARFGWSLDGSNVQDIMSMINLGKNMVKSELRSLYSAIATRVTSKNLLKGKQHTPISV